MTKTIFRNTFLVGVLVLIVCAVLFVGLQYTQTIDENKAALKQEASYVKSGLEKDGTDYLKLLDKTNRITLIDSEGNVSYDNEYSAPLPNQGGYEEVSKAYQSGEGSAVRKSDSSGQQTIYYAIKLNDGTVLRISRPVSAVTHALVTVSPILWVLVLVLIISGILAFRAAKQIVTPINELDLDNPGDNNYPELAPLLDKIEEQRMTIQEEASIRQEMRKEFSSNVSNELKSPLISISDLAGQLTRKDIPKDKVKELSGSIYKESQRLINLIDDFVQLNLLDEGDDIPPKEDVDLMEISKSVATELRQAASKNNISIKVKGKPTHIMGVEQILHEMVYNLCDNAVKYNYPGGKVFIETVDEEKEAKLIVSDTGIGIPKEHQKRVFERFYRVDKTHSKEIGGTGLGLSIVKHGAAYHNATVSMKSHQGKGTRIEIVFPKEEQTESE